MILLTRSLIDFLSSKKSLGLRNRPAGRSRSSCGAGAAGALAAAVTAMGEGLAVGLKVRTAGPSRSSGTVAGTLKHRGPGEPGFRGFPCW